MSWDLWSVGRHNLKLDDVESVARQLSDALDINIQYGKDRGDWDDNIVLGRIIRKDGSPIYLLDHELGYEYPMFDMEYPFFDEKERKGSIAMLDIHNETVSICFWDDPVRWGDYHLFFSGEENPLSMEYLNKFRRVAKDVYRKLGAEYIYCFADQGPSMLVGDHWQDPWDEFEHYIHSLKYLEEFDDFTLNPMKEGARVFRVSDFFLGKDKSYSKTYADIFLDDFADLH